MNGKYRYLSITGPAVAILIDTLLYRYFPSLFGLFTSFFGRRLHRRAMGEDIPKTPPTQKGECISAFTISYQITGKHFGSGAYRWKRAPSDIRCLLIFRPHFWLFTSFFDRWIPQMCNGRRQSKDTTNSEGRMYEHIRH